MRTSMPTAFMRSQRSEESALVSRYVPSPSRLTVPSSIDLAGVVAPRRVVDLARLQLGHVAGDHAVEEPRRVRPRDPVLVERRDVDQRGRAADRRVLAVGMRIVGAGHLVAGPAAPRLRADERRGARMEW